MKIKTFLILLGILFLYALVASADNPASKYAQPYTHATWYITDSFPVNDYVRYEKTYDENTNIVCYSVFYIHGASISCLKNN